MDRSTANDSPALDDGCTLAEFGGLNGCFLSGRTAADDEKVILLHLSSLLSLEEAVCRLWPAWNHQV